MVVGRIVEQLLLASHMRLILIEGGCMNDMRDNSRVDSASPAAPSIAEQVDLVPTDPGCYLWKDARGEILYVGKAKNLRARMRQYVHGLQLRLRETCSELCGRGTLFLHLRYGSGCAHGVPDLS